MRKFFRPILLFARYNSDLSATVQPRTKTMYRFDPGNQNHLSKVLADASMNRSWNKKAEFDKESFLKKYSQATPILNICSSYGLDENCIMEAVEKYPEILNFDHSNISSIIYQFQSLGFRENTISAIISQYPHVLQYKPTDLSETIDVYRKNHFGERFIIKLLVTYPLLLSLSNEDLNDRLKRINYLLENKINRSTNVLLRNPAILCCPWQDVEQKFNYLYRQMRLLPKDMSRSQALTKPLSFIMLRHTFLDRCGIFVRHGLKDDDGFNPHKNPTLSEIVDTSDNEFARKVAKVSPEEYEVFKTLMKYEEELQDEVEDDDLEVSPLNMSSDFDLKD